MNNSTRRKLSFIINLEDKLEKQVKPVNGKDKGDTGVGTQTSEENADKDSQT